MTKKKDAKEINYFVEDANLFSLWFLSNPRFHPRNYLGMDEITPMDSWEYKRVFNFLKTRLEIAGAPFPAVGSYNDIPENELSLPPKDEELKSYTQEGKAKIIEASGKFMKHDFGINELELLGGIRHSIYKWVYLEPAFSKENIQKLTKHIDTYIDLFLNNELFVYDRNYLTFEKQKQIFIERVRKMSALEKYGENFVISSEEYDGSSKNDGFLFVHTLYALQKLGYIGIMRIWANRDGVYNKRIYYANIVAFNSFIEEINNSFRKDNPATIFEGYDGKRNILKFAGKEIELSKKKKETDAVLLIKTLLKKKNDWSFNDEIAEDWDIATADEAAKNKAYFAARKINEAVKMQTGIEDFIDHNTSKFRINPKYLKVDE